MPAIRPIILCGGSGTRLWPLSRQHFPKQFVPLVGGKSLLHLTLERLGHLNPFVTCLTNEDYRFLVLDQMSELKLEGELILEPLARNTAPAMALAALRAQPDELLLFCPSDHFIPDAVAFKRTIEEGVDAAKGGMIVTFGIKPTYAATAYGYIEVDKFLGGEAIPVRRFIEKPDALSAEKLISKGNVLWNGGIFLVKASTLIEGLAKNAPDILGAAKASIEAATEETFSYHGRGYSLLRPDEKAFAGSRSESIDYALLESATNVAVVMFDEVWSDVGSWQAVAGMTDPDTDGNRILGRGRVFNSSNTYIHAPHRPVVTLGVENLIVVDTPDALLIAERSQAEAVKDVVNALSNEGVNETHTHRKTARPWGSFDAIDEDKNFKVKRIVVKPGSKISLQRHSKRSEHWVVVEGEATVTLKDKVTTLKKNESTFIPMGETHRLANNGKADLVIIEVQVGDYLGEDDIERFEDTYGRHS